jgi:hypothetical protein
VGLDETLQYSYPPHQSELITLILQLYTTVDEQSRMVITREKKYDKRKIIGPVMQFNKYRFS